MAKKHKYELDDFGFPDNSLDIPDFNFDTPPPKDDRNPATKIVTGLGSGVKSTVKDSRFIRDMVKTSLPKGYGEAMELADTSAGSVRGLYNDAAKEIKPVIKDLKRTTGKLMPSLEASLPKNVSAKIKKWVESDQQSQSMSADAQQESALQMQLGEIFQFQAKAGARRNAEEDARDVIRDGIDAARHTDQIGQLDSMRISLQQLANYQSKVEIGFQRKSLELQFRGYFLAQKAFEEQQRFNAESKAHLEGILKNTALPEFAKLKGSERFQEVMRNKFIDSVNDGVFGKRRDFIKNVAGKLSGVVKDKASSFASNFKAGLDAADSAVDMRQMMREMGDNRGGLELGSEIAGGALATSLGHRAAKKLRTYIPEDGKIGRFGTKLSYGVNNAPQLLTDWSNANPYDTPDRKGIIGKLIGLLDEGGALGGVGNTLKETIRSVNAVDNTLIGDSAGGMQEPAPYTRGTNKSITEIIPGYLSRIYRELQIMRTGNPDIDLTLYDYNSNKFSEKSAVAKKLFDKTISKFDKDSLKDQVDEVMNTIDPEGKLSPEQRMAFAKQMLKDNLSNKSGSFKRLSNSDSYKGEAGKYAEVFVSLFEEMAKKDTNGRQQLHFADKFSRVGSYMSDQRRSIQDQLNVGNREILEELGFVDKDTNTINMDKLNSYLLGEEYAASGNGGKAAQFRSGSHLRKNISKPRSPFEQVQSSGPSVHTAASGYRDTSVAGGETKGCCNELVKAINESSSKAASESINETLLRIEQKLHEGIATSGDGEGGESTINNKGAWWNRSVRSLGGSAYKLGKKSLGKFKGFIDSAIGNAKNLGGKALGLGTDMFNKGLEKWKGIKDVWIDGEFTPRLQAWKIKAGHYRDQATGQIIKTYKDIKGAVVDENGNIVLTVEQARDAFVKSGPVQKAIKLLGAGVGKIKDAADRLMSKIPPAIMFAKDLAVKAYGLLKLPQDVYTKDRPDVPTLLAKTMKSGGYVSRITSKVIQNTDDIDGPVYDERGNEVLTAEEFAKGLYDSQGRPIRNGFGKITGTAKDVLKFARDKFNKGRELAGKVIRKGIDTVKSVFKGGIHIGGNLGISAGEANMDRDLLIIKRLTEIRNILDGRLPGKKAKVIGDADGDGVREGSVADKLKKKKDAALEKAKELASGAKEKGRGLLGLGAAGLAALRDKFKKKKDEDEEDDGEGVGDMAEQAVANKFVDKLGGWGKSAWGGIKKAGKWGGRLLGKGGKGLLGLAGRGALMGGSLLGLGGAGTAAAGTAAATTAAAAGTAAAGTAAAGTAGAVGLGGAAAAGGGILAGIGAFLASPVVLGALAIAAVGTAGYLGYKYLTKKRLDVYSKVRYAQYGFLPTDDEHVQPVLGLEDVLRDATTFDGGIAKLNGDKLKIGDLVKAFNVSVENKQDLRNWLDWFNNRFKPVYLTHMTALNSVAPNKSLSDVSSLKPEEIKKYLDIAKYPDGPYSVYTSPFPGVKQLDAGRAEVDTVVATANNEIIKQIGEKKDGKSGAETGITAAVSPTLALATAKKPTDGSVDKSELKKVTDKTAGNLGLGEKGTSISVAGIAMLPSEYGNGRVDALTTIRFKTYGLMKLELDKVKAINQLELVVNKKLKFDKGVASWSGSVDDILKEVGTAFGIEGVNNKDGYSWIAWFNFRFLPTYLNYLSTLAKLTGKQDPTTAAAALTEQQKVDLAMAIYTSKSKGGGLKSASVWTITETPWPGYELNSDSKSVEQNIQGLKDVAKAKVLEEAESKKTDTGLKGNGGQSTLQRVVDRTKDVTKGMIAGAAKGATTGSTLGIVTGAVKGGISAMSGGREMGTTSAGTGGSLDQIPSPKGEGSWPALSETIRAAAKMVGVDESLMAVMAAIESGFRTTVKAGTSSATGLYQFISSTWNTMLRKYGEKYGIPPGTSPTDPRANALMGAEFIKENTEALSGAIGRPVTDTDVYIAHFLGAAGAKKLLKADPNAIAANLLPDAARANTSIFYAKDGSPLTVGQVYALINGRVRSKGKQFGLGGDGSEEIVTSQPATSAAANTAKPTDAKTPAAAVPQAKTSNPLGNFAVSDQAPGLSSSAPTQPMAQQKQATPSATSVQGTDPAVAAASSGFASPRARSLEAQNQYRKESSVEFLADVPKTLQDSLLVQQGQLDMLNKIYALMGKNATAKSGSQNDSTPAASTQTPRRAPSEMPQAPVSMGKG